MRVISIPDFSKFSDDEKLALFSMLLEHVSFDDVSFPSLLVRNDEQAYGENDVSVGDV